ncbi:hypothetical protein A8C56_18905 [Niabella ginsenosidivorans]|uniref:Uncharacterized protein n=1 Tax=Niabella ginsenosidivorans TaxID=1176587 RepID=A0A1A9I5D5_9BACT|nr:hypothetical protein [Niabella ginsenosidivorans]ANH82773.1 hypothetical protein A8C56_18905 [Niabella ginsenosidivorans]
MLSYTPELKNSYRHLFNICTIKNEKVAVVNRIVQKIFNNKVRYTNVAHVLSMPWYVIAVIHSMEADLNFNCHLHNGDPLTARTVHAPAGRPLTGTPPFPWEFSAVDALKFDGFDQWADWSLAGICYKLEKYNGTGYRAFLINSPYLWSGSNLYACGKYIADGTFSRTAVSGQIGAMVLLKDMSTKGLITFQNAIITAPEVPHSS